MSTSGKSGAPLRVVSLVPSSTETLLSLGADVIACTRFCEQPDIAHVGGTKNPNVEEIIALAPDLVVMDSEENRREDADALERAGVRLFVTCIRSVAGAEHLVADLANLIGVEALSMEEMPTPATPRSSLQRVFVPIWRRPWMSIGATTYGASVLDRLGYELVTFGDDDYPAVELADVVAGRPDIIAIPSEPYAFTEGHLDELRAVVPAARVVRLDGRDLFWWGVRTPAALIRLSAVLDPMA